MNEIISLHRMGVPISDIAKKLNMTEEHVARIIGNDISDPTQIQFAKERERKEKPIVVGGKKYLDVTDWFMG